jgi:hypothetical protein
VIQVVDGHWSQDGSSVVVTDVAGQWHLYSVGAFAFPGACLYDQFVASDYLALVRDANQYVLDAETQLAPHLRQQRCAWKRPVSLSCCVTGPCYIIGGAQAVYLCFTWFSLCHRGLLGTM